MTEQFQPWQTILVAGIGLPSILWILFKEPEDNYLLTSLAYLGFIIAMIWVSIIQGWWMNWDRTIWYIMPVIITWALYESIRALVLYIKGKG